MEFILFGETPFLFRQNPLLFFVLNFPSFVIRSLFIKAPYNVSYMDQSSAFHVPGCKQGDSLAPEILITPLGFEVLKRDDRVALYSPTVNFDRLVFSQDEQGVINTRVEL